MPGKLTEKGIPSPSAPQPPAAAAAAPDLTGVIKKMVLHCKVCGAGAMPRLTAAAGCGGLRSISAKLVLCLAALLYGASAEIMQERELLRMPHSIDLTNASIVRVNGGPPIFDQFVVDVWRLGDVKLQPLLWRASDWTGLDVPEGSQGEFQRGPSPSVAGSTAVQYFNGTFGANLNLFTDPIQPNQSLATITMEYNWGAETRCAPWAAPAARLELSLLYQVPVAARNASAVYATCPSRIQNM